VGEQWGIHARLRGPSGLQGQVGAKLVASWPCLNGTSYSSNLPSSGSGFNSRLPWQFPPSSFTFAKALVVLVRNWKRRERPLFHGDIPKRL
jgi:hypothetical protein